MSVILGLMRRFAAVIVLVVVVVGFILVRQYVPNDAGSLQVGDCFDLPTVQTDIKGVQNHPCQESHDAEVFAALDHPAPRDTAYPISSSFLTFAKEQCIPAFGAYTKLDLEQQPDLDLGFFYPTSSGWSKGDRRVICYIHRVDKQKSTGSRKAS